VRFTVVTILPELIEPALGAGVVGRAREAGIITVDTVNPRDFTRDRHKTVDDTPYGGGPGMVMKAEPLLAAIAKACEPRAIPPRPTPSDDVSVDVLGQPHDPLAKVEDALAKVESIIGGIEGGAGPLTSARRLHEVSSSVAEAEATIKEIESALGREVPEADLSPPDRQPDRQRKRPETAEQTFESIDGHVAVDKLGNVRRGSLGPADDVPRVEAPPPEAHAAAAEEMPHLIAAPESATSSLAPAVAPPPKPHRILLSPSGAPLTQARVRELAKHDHLVLVCGRYEGVDQRVIDLAIDEELSIGDYVLSGGELGALVIIDAVARFVPGVLGEPTSADDESFSAGLLEYPQYTRPQELTHGSKALAVPPVLQTGNHAAIAAWRKQRAMERTAQRRPDLWKQFRATKADDKLLAPLRARTHVALVHHPVVDRTGAVVTTAVTNFDIHDIARSSMTYGLAGYHLVTPVTSQREKAEHIASMWMADTQGEHRAAALRLIRTAAAVEDVIAALTEEHGRAPVVVATSARAESFPAAARRTSSELIAEATLDPAPLLILLGTGWGLADSLIPSVSRVLAPIEGASPWNHLSVRSAAAVILDRLFGHPA
jgi:tRNA (guanine37-N1)-methyltransferase